MSGRYVIEGDVLYSRHQTIDGAHIVDLHPLPPMASPDVDEWTDTERELTH